MPGKEQKISAFYLNQIVAVLASTLFIDGGMALGILLALLLLFNAAVYFFKLSARRVCLLPYLLLPAAVGIAYWASLG